jgi:putative ATP-binding cassette transporter
MNSTLTLPPTEALISRERKKTAGQASALRETVALFMETLRAKSARGILFFGVAAIFVLTLDVLGEIRMNRWQGDFYRAIEQRDYSGVGHQAGLFVLIMVVLLSFVVTQNWLVERMKIKMREWFTNRLLDDWMRPGAAYRLNMTSEERLNPDQRMQEDVKHLSELSGDLGSGAIRACLMLLSFVGVLWVLSSGIALPIGGREFVIPGYMVWFALVYAGLGSWLAARVGAPLIDLNETRYSREAAFRYSLVRINDNAESISLYSGERDERKIVTHYLGKVLKTMKTLALANARLTWISCGHGWLTVILPVVIALPGYMQGRLDFGKLMMVVGAFNQVQQSLRWFVENFARIADWRASLHRVVVLREAVATVDEFENHPDMIQLEENPEGFLEFDKAAINLVDGRVVIADATAKIHPGERVLITGESGSGKSTLLRAVGGLWPWGSGKILLPPAKEMMFLPQRPYIPLGTLAEAIAYPHMERVNDRKAIEECLRRVNLEAFIERLDQSERWDEVMSLGQQQRLAFARLLLHKPKWIFLDEATSALDDNNQAQVMSIFTQELAGSAVLSIGHRKGLEQFHTRTMHLKLTGSGRVLIKKPKPELVERQTLLRKLGLKTSSRD